MSIVGYQSIDGNLAIMSDPSVLLLTAIVFLPALSAIVIALLPSNKPDVIRFATLGVTIAVLILTVLGLMDPLGWQAPTKFVAAKAEMQGAFNVSWIPSFDIEYFMGMDGISFPLVMLTAFISVLAMGASWSITKAVKGYCILFLLLETGMLGVFLALDFFLFYVFWEVMLLPMYFLIGVWGGPRKEYAALKFFLYTLAGSVLMLVAILMLYFSSDVRVLSDEYLAGSPADRPIRWSEMHLGDSVNEKLGVAEYNATDSTAPSLLVFRRGAANTLPLTVKFAAGASAASFDEATTTLTITVPAETSTAAEAVKAVEAGGESVAAVVAVRPVSADDAPIAAGDSLEIAPYNPEFPVHSFNLLALAAMGQHTTLFDGEILGQSLQWWAFLLLFIGFIIKVPSVPLHTWLPDAHVEAPTPISMILAGVLLKMGGYGIIRICYPICPAGGYELMSVVCALGVISMVYGAFAALAQKDFKRMVAYSSVSHMGYVTLGLGVWSATAGNAYNPDYWNMGIQGAMFQMIGHGVSSAGMFFMVGIIYDRVHHRNLDEFGGLFGKMPMYTAMAMGLFFAALGLPGLCGFPGEVFVVLSVWKFSIVLAAISASVVILTAAYILWAMQRVYLGAEYKGPHGEHIHPTNLRENLIGCTLLVFAIIFGVFPHTVLQYMEKTITRQTGDLAAWTRDVKEKDLVPPATVEEPKVTSQVPAEKLPAAETTPTDVSGG